MYLDMKSNTKLTIAKATNDNTVIHAPPVNPFRAIIHGIAAITMQLPVIDV